MEALRRKIAALSKALPAEEIRVRSKAAVRNLATWLAANTPNSALIGLYRPSERNAWGEADPGELVAEPALAEFHFAFPRVTDRIHREMDFSIPIGPTDWSKGIYGNPEPWTDLPSVDPQAFDLIVVPGVVFGVAGERIGRGAGFYDRYLRTVPRAVRIGFGFDFQLLTEPVPQAEWDARMDVVVTDRRVITTSARPSV